MELPPYTLSRRAPSTARPPLRNAPQAGLRNSSGAPRRVQRGPGGSAPGWNGTARYAADSRAGPNPRFPTDSDDARDRPCRRGIPHRRREANRLHPGPRVQGVLRRGIRDPSAATRPRRGNARHGDAAVRPAPRAIAADERSHPSAGARLHRSAKRRQPPRPPPRQLQA